MPGGESSLLETRRAKRKREKIDVLLLSIYQGKEGTCAEKKKKSSYQSLSNHGLPLRVP